MKKIKNLSSIFLAIILLFTFGIATLADETEYTLKGKIKKQPINGFSFWYSPESDCGTNFPVNSLKQCEIDSLSLKIQPPKSAVPDRDAVKWFSIATLNNTDIVQIVPDTGYSAAIKWECPESGTYHVYIDVWLGSWSIPKPSELGDGICDGVIISSYHNNSQLFNINTPGTDILKNAKQADSTADPIIPADIDKDMKLVKGDALYIIVDPKTAAGWDQVACNFSITKGESTDAPVSSSKDSRSSKTPSSSSSSKVETKTSDINITSNSNETNVFNLRGKVLDSKGNTMANSEVKFDDVSIRTDSKGAFSFIDLPLKNGNITVFDESGAKKGSKSIKVAKATGTNKGVVGDYIYVDDSEINLLVKVKDDGTIELSEDKDASIDSATSIKSGDKDNSTGATKANTKAKLNVGRLILLIVGIVVILGGAGVAIYFLVIKKKLEEKKKQQ